MVGVDDPALESVARLEPFGLYLGRIKEIWTKEHGFNWNWKDEGFAVGENTLARMFPDDLTAAHRNQPGELWWLN